MNLLKIFLFFFLSTQAFAGWNCSEAWSKCSADSAQCNVNGYTCSACYQVDQSMVGTNFGSLSTGSGNGQRLPYNCKQEVLQCASPKVKVGTLPNGDDECECGQGKFQLSSIPEGWLGACGNGECCIASDGCASGFTSAPYTSPDGAYLHPAMAGKQCVPEAPKPDCPEGELKNPYGQCTRLKGDEVNAPECENGDFTSSWKPQLNTGSSTQYHLDIVHSKNGTGSRVRTHPLKCRCTSGKYRMKDYMHIVQYSDGSSQDRSNFIPDQAALCVVPPSSSPSDPASPDDGSESIPDSHAPESPEDMTFPDFPPYMTCNDVVTGVTGAMVCKPSDGSPPKNAYCADTQKYADDPSSIETVCYSGNAIAQAANTGCSGEGNAYLVGGRWQCSSTPPPIDSMSNPEQGCPAGTVQTSICSDWQCLPPSYRLPASLD
jgi:hypothetical protein